MASPRRLAVLALGALLPGACTLTAVHKPPPEGTERAYVKFESRGAGVGRVNRIEGEPACGAPRERRAVLFTVSRNPLIPNVNLDGTWVRAGEKITVSTTSMGLDITPTHKIHTMCGTLSSFTPRAGATYVLRIDFDEAANHCRTSLAELAPNPGAVADFTRLSCAEWDRGDAPPPAR